MKIKHMCVGSLLCLSLLIGCQVQNNNPRTSPVVFPTPTIHPYFRSSGSTQILSAGNAVFESQTYLPTPTLTPSPTPKASSTPIVSQTPVITGTQEITPAETSSLQPTLTSLSTRLIAIYNDSLDPGWIIQNGSSATIDLNDTTTVHDGKSAIAITPKLDFSLVAFHVKAPALAPFMRNEILGLSFWLNSGKNTLAIDDLAVGFLGSDAKPYWVPNDSSVDPRLFDPIFTEKGEYLLDLNQAIPPNTWVYVEILLDDLKYDTNYQYLTGFQFKNNAGFEKTFYIDDVYWIQLVSGR